MYEDQKDPYFQETPHPLKAGGDTYEERALREPRLPVTPSKPLEVEAAPNHLPVEPFQRVATGVNDVLSA